MIECRSVHPSILRRLQQLVAGPSVAIAEADAVANYPSTGRRRSRNRPVENATAGKWRISKHSRSCLTGSDDGRRWSAILDSDCERPSRVCVPDPLRKKENFGLFAFD